MTNTGSYTWKRGLQNKTRSYRQSNLEGNSRGRGRTQIGGMEKGLKHLKGLKKLQVAPFGRIGAVDVTQNYKTVAIRAENQQKDRSHKTRVYVRLVAQN